MLAQGLQARSSGGIASMPLGVILSRWRGGNGMGAVLSQLGGKGVLFPVSGGLLEARDAA